MLLRRRPLVMAGAIADDVVATPTACAPLLPPEPRLLLRQRLRRLRLPLMLLLPRGRSGRTSEPPCRRTPPGLVPSAQRCLAVRLNARALLVGEAHRAPRRAPRRSRRAAARGGSSRGLSRVYPLDTPSQSSCHHVHPPPPLRHRATRVVAPERSPPPRFTAPPPTRASNSKRPAPPPMVTHTLTCQRRPRELRE